MKTVVIFHGFPKLLTKNKSTVFNYFLSNNYRVIMPNLLSTKLKFNINEILKYILFELNGKEPDVIVGISLGGLLAPNLATIFPESKLILIGTGHRFKTKIPLYNRLVHIEARDERLLLVKLLRLTPRWLFRFVYNYLNKSDDLSNRTNYIRADEVYDDAFRLSSKKIKEILEFISKINNIELLQRLSNKTIIFAGKNDSIMPVQLSDKINSLMKNSTLIILNKIHYDICAQVDYHQLNEFIN